MYLDFYGVCRASSYAERAVETRLIVKNSCNLLPADFGDAPDPRSLGTHLPTLPAASAQIPVNNDFNHSKSN